MLNDVVNTITFDFNCESEIAAKSMRNEILNYKAYQVSSILSEVLAEKIDRSTLWKIDKIEIDLGNINLEEIGTDIILNKFKDSLSKNIDEARRNLHQESGPGDLSPGMLNNGSHPNAVELSPGEGQLDIIKELLLHGDLPWWIDKNTFSGVDKTVREVMSQNPEGLVFFLDSQKSNPEVLGRIPLFFSPETVSLLNSIAPGITGISPLGSFNLSGEKVRLEKLSSQDLQKIVDSLKKRISAGNQNVKLLMIKRLLEDDNEYLLPGIKMLGVLAGNEIAALELFFGNKRRGKIESENVLRILQKLSILQVEFLSHPVLFKTSRAEGPVTNNIISGAENKQKAISDITDKLRTKNPLLLDELYNTPEESLYDLQTLFSQYQKHSFIKQKMISLIIEHPYFLKYKLLTLLANLSFEFPESVRDSDSGRPLNFQVIKQSLKESQSVLQKVMKGLTKKQARIFKDVFSAGAFPSAFAKKAIAQVLNRLPDKTLLIISALTHLDERAIEKLVPFSAAGPTASTSFRKTIIENAGLCILAPYLPAFFKHLGFIENGQFKTKASTHRALYLLEYIVTGRQRNYEYVMQLNKLLCGLKINESITGYKRLTTVEKNEAEDLISSVINHWKVLKSTSQKGLRNSFLQRKGILTEQENLWVLQVEKKGYDLLMDSIPWSFNLVKFPWMDKRIQVEW